jgi:hypothetical protein
VDSSLHCDGVKPEQDHAYQHSPLDGEFITVLANRPWRMKECMHPRPWTVEAMRVVGQTIDRDVAEQHKRKPLPAYEACAVWYPSSQTILRS